MKTIEILTDFFFWTELRSREHKVGEKPDRPDLRTIDQEVLETTAFGLKKRRIYL